MFPPRPTALLLLATAAGAAAGAGHARATAQVAPFAEAMHVLSRTTEDALHWLVRGDFRRLEHVSIELVRATDRSLSLAQARAFPPEFLDLMLEMAEHGSEFQEEVRRRDLEEAAEEYLDFVEVCFKCHVDRL